MNTLLLQLLAMTISASLFMTLSIKLGWSKKLWGVINRLLKPIYNVVVWILFAVVFNIIIQMICGALGITDYRIITGALMGFYFAFIPNLGEKR